MDGDIELSGRARPPMCPLAVPLLIGAVAALRYATLVPAPAMLSDIALFLHVYRGSAASAVIVDLQVSAGADKAGAAVKLPRRLWDSSFSMRCQDAPLSAELVKGPENSDLAFAPKARYRFVYKVPSRLLPPGGGLLTASVKRERVALQAAARIPAAPGGPLARLENDALAASVLGDAAGLENTAEAMIEHGAGGFSAYWYIGLAREMQGRPDEAL